MSYSINYLLTRGATVVVLAATGCSRSTSAEQRASRAVHDTGDIVIGVAWPWQARREMQFGAGLDMAVDEINAHGGIHGRRLRLERRDDHESTDEGRAIAQSFAADPNVIAVIGHLQSYVSVPASAIYDNAGLVMLAPAATDPELTAQGYHRVFRATFTDKAVGHEMAEYAGRRGYRRVAIEYVRSTYGRDLANAFEEHSADVGITVVARQSYGADQVTRQTFETTVRDWQRLDLDAVFLAGEVPSAAYFIAEARRQHLDLPILGGDALGSPSLVAIAGQAAEGTVVPSVFHPDEPRREVQTFTSKFRRRVGTVPDAGSALGYDAVHLLATAIARAPTADPDRIAEALHAMRNWNGVTGRLSFDSAGDLTAKQIVKMVVRDGRFVYLPDQPVVRVAMP
jgi:branched-chain amino acid transport system substrate-binding protein